MSDFSPFMVLILVWMVIGLPLSMIVKKNKASSNTARRPASGSPDRSAKTAPEGSESTEGTGNTEGLSGSLPYASSKGSSLGSGLLRPTVAPGRHDDSLYQGSLNAVTGEGFDPCHDDQLEGLRRAEAEPAFIAAPQPAPGLRLTWTSNDVVRGIVMSEILNRKTLRR